MLTDLRTSHLPSMPGRRPLIVGMGGTPRPASTSERAVVHVLDRLAKRGADTRMFAGADLAFPIFDPTTTHRPEPVARLIAALREADAIVIGSPGYHGSISGLIKNALDYAEELRGDDRAYFDGRAVGCIASAAGWHATGSTLQALRSIVHALRGWPTPLGVAINSAEPVFDRDGECVDEKVRGALDAMANHVWHFLRFHDAPGEVIPFAREVEKIAVGA